MSEYIAWYLAGVAWGYWMGRRKRGLAGGGE